MDRCVRAGFLAFVFLWGLVLLNLSAILGVKCWCSSFFRDVLDVFKPVRRLRYRFVLWRNIGNRNLRTVLLKIFDAFGIGIVKDEYVYRVFGVHTGKICTKYKLVRFDGKVLTNNFWRKYIDEMRLDDDSAVRFFRKMKDTCAGGEFKFTSLREVEKHVGPMEIAAVKFLDRILKGMYKIEIPDAHSIKELIMKIELRGV